ncbi:hypothetical protein [Myroides pelagicus]|uniref:DUF38 domain-containing protein n=1 Tax=Myroides pelagicus TaxID=270914 RepID=A0A7K1GK22_9FLAO|nr:hypothetical protein [Myroides pelagicus]MEC4113434.1 hypothetical protein [Myroides pelagicus]MTH29232.1 hypothetical protein [Myroides pelagicus]
MVEKLLALQERIYTYYNREYPFSLSYSPRISFAKLGEFYELNYFGDGYDEDITLSPDEIEQNDDLDFAFCAVLDFIIAHPNSFVSLNFNGPDAGANGVRNWNFNRLVESGVVLSHVKSFKVGLTNMGDHHVTLIGEYDLEEGVIAKLVAKMPKLKVLQMPSAPDKSFFELDNLKIEELVIQSGLNHQNFVTNLSRSKNMRSLRLLDFTDVFEMAEDTGKTKFTSVMEYMELFKSELFQHTPNFLFKLRDCHLSVSNSSMLKRLANVQLLHIVEVPGRYR